MKTQGSPPGPYPVIPKGLPVLSLEKDDTIGTIFNIRISQNSQWMRAYERDAFHIFPVWDSWAIPWLHCHFKLSLSESWINLQCQGLCAWWLAQGQYSFSLWEPMNIHLLVRGPEQQSRGDTVLPWWVGAWALALHGPRVHLYSCWIFTFMEVAVSPWPVFSST